MNNQSLESVYLRLAAPGICLAPTARLDGTLTIGLELYVQSIWLCGMVEMVPSKNKKGKVARAWSALDFRHTFGSQLAQKGVSLYKISALMGNSPEICRRHYAALVPQSLRSSVEFDTEHDEQQDTTVKIYTFHLKSIKR